ncbi:HpcH/HpaI aldolase family protein [Rhodococcus globerulus]|uniref:Aldolase/citrate lyase family protein n=1 Tax=Rhodococcus globerulus TaxID=33008 RepID=A0ABU4C4L9_RHOGO|nr:aldolase/citrate lyase family protein [Rhodococcus globerulus]MDV6271454.1 aldolase/citrate lyase family protein [Rhodococcus globerulus]
MRDNVLLSRLRRGEVSVASFLTVPDPFVAELMAQSQMDALIVDTEHSPMSSEQLHGVLTALHPSDSTVIVRVADKSDVYIKQALDLGAEGVLVPGVSSRSDCEAVVASSLYAPRGSRGFGPRRASRLYGSRADYLTRANDNVAVIAMVEDVAGVDAIEEIVTVDGLSAIFVGVGDLAVSMGYILNPGAAEVEEAVSAVARSCASHNVPFGVFTGTEVAARQWISQGALLVTLGSDLGYIDAGIARTRDARANLF